MSRTCLPALLALILSSGALADVTPASVDAVLEPGESTEVIEKTVTLPEVTPKIDVVLLVDLSGSYNNDLVNLQTQPGGVDGLAAELFDGVCVEGVDCQFALASFVDFPFYPWGHSPSGDYAYRLDQDFTTSRTDFVLAVDAMATKNGYDSPESQYEALFQVATGYGREMPLTLDGGYTDAGEIEPGLNPDFRPDATKVVVITTDAGFHEEGDACVAYPYTPTFDVCSFTYPGADGPDTTDALLLAGIKVIGLTGGSATLSELDALATATGGASLLTTTDSSDIVTATLEGLEALTFEVTAEPDAACAPLEFDYDPASHSDVLGGESVVFDETITVPYGVTEGDLDPDGKIVCDVYFKADDTVIGTQEVSIEVVLNKPPIAQCAEVTVDADEFDCLGEADINDGSYDPEGDPLTYAYDPAGPYEVGATTVTLTVTDPEGLSGTCSADVIVVDATPPVITVGEGLELWPPNHKYVDFALSDCDVTIVDSCTGELDVDGAGVITSITSDEPEDVFGKGDGKTIHDMIIWGDFEFSLRAERQGADDGRVYHVNFEVDDGAENVQTATCDVTVPHANNGVPAEDSGVAWTVYPPVPE